MVDAERLSLQMTVLIAAPEASGKDRFPICVGVGAAAVLVRLNPYTCTLLLESAAAYMSVAGE